MSVSLYVFPACGDESTPFDRTIVQQAFGSLIADPSDDHWEIVTLDGEFTGVGILIGLEPKITGFSVDHPPGFKEFPEFWDALIEVLQRTPAGMLWPCDARSNYCVANAAAAAVIPADFVESFGPPYVVSSVADIEAAMIETNF